jgi:hypothetical protein
MTYLLNVQIPVIMSKSLTTAVELLAKFRSLLAAYPRVLWSSATVAALLLILRYAAAKKKGKYVADLSKVGTSGPETVWEASEYDVIIVGGGIWRSEYLSIWL